MAKKLLITYSFPPRVGGIENYYFNLCGRLDPNEIVVLAHIHYQSQEFDSKQDYKIYRTDFFSGKFPPRWRQMKNTIKDIIAKEGIEEIIFGHFHPFCLLGAELGLPYFVFNHGSDITQANDWWQKRSLLKVYQHPLCLKFIVNSNFLADQVASLVGNRSKIEIVNPGIDFDSLIKEAEGLVGKKELLGFSSKDIVLVSMGRIEPEKNLEAIIKLMPELLPQIPNLKYLIVGEGSDLERLQGLAVNYGLKYQVIFTGAVDTDSDIKSFYYQLGHIFVVPSLKPEGFGISYLEASAAKTAVIASKFGGSAEAVKDGETGILVDPNNSEEIKNAILKLVSDQGLWEKMSSAGVLWARGFDWKYQLEKIKQIIG
jgi:phosphatidyl-myo-inositol dimannoside synthase